MEQLLENMQKSLFQPQKLWLITNENTYKCDPLAKYQQGKNSGYG